MCGFAKNDDISSVVATALGLVFHHMELQLELEQEQPGWLPGLSMV